MSTLGMKSLNLASYWQSEARYMRGTIKQKARPKSTSHFLYSDWLEVVNKGHMDK